MLLVLKCSECAEQIIWLIEINKNYSVLMLLLIDLLMTCYISLIICLLSYCSQLNN